VHCWRSSRADISNKLGIRVPGAQHAAAGNTAKVLEPFVWTLHLLVCLYQLGAGTITLRRGWRAKGLLNQRVTAGADLVNQVAESAKHAADHLDQSAPQLAELVRGAADRAEEFSRDLRDRSVDELIRTASDFTRRRPALVFGLASLAGFFLFRVIKANPSNGSFQQQPAAALWRFASRAAPTGAPPRRANRPIPWRMTSCEIPGWCRA
jgi:hypothetical protein